MKQLPFLAILLAGTFSATGSPIILSSNMGLITQPGAITSLPDPISATVWNSARFGTDANQYWLNTVTLALENNSFANVSLYNDVAGTPGQPLAALSGGTRVCQQQSSTALCEYSYSGNGFALQPNSNYWIVVSGGGTGTSGYWFYTISSQGTGPGFQPVWARTSNAGVNWNVAQGNPMLMAVTADTPEPGTVAMLASALILCGLIRSRAVKR